MQGRRADLALSMPFILFSPPISSGAAVQVMQQAQPRSVVKVALRLQQGSAAAQSPPASPARQGSAVQLLMHANVTTSPADTAAHNKRARAEHTAAADANGHRGAGGIGAHVLENPTFDKAHGDAAGQTQADLSIYPSAMAALPAV